jgi:hypothetical protein
MPLCECSAGSIQRDVMTADEPVSTQSLLLDLFFEEEATREFAFEAASGLRQAVARLAPSVDVQVEIHLATNVVPWEFNAEGRAIRIVRHASTSSDRQSLLITDMDLGALGWGTKGSAVVNRQGMEQKAASGGDPIDIVVHEWIHTLEGISINGRPVPFADDATKYGFVAVAGADGQDRWDAWFSYALGVGPSRSRSD